MRLYFTVFVASMYIATMGFADGNEGSYAKPEVSAANIRSMMFVIKGRLGIRAQQLRPGSEVQKAVDALLAAETHKQLHRIPEQWRKDLPKPMRNELIRELLRRMDSRKETKFKRTDDVVVLIHPYVNVEWIQKHFAAEKAGKPVGSYFHDIYIEGGRCAWALGEFLHLELLNIFEPMSNEDMAAAVRENTFIVIEALGSPDEIDFNLMDAPQRRALAAKTRNRLLVWKMSKDEDREVRLTLARRPELGFVDEVILLSVLSKDLDNEISTVAKASYKAYLENRAFPKLKPE